MKVAELNSMIRRALNNLIKNETFLLDNDASEWSISHRLAIYIEQEIPGWNVDCEYNRQGKGKEPKTNRTKDNVRPDIVLHHRGRASCDHNMLVIEVKKNRIDKDAGKACEYTCAPRGGRKYQYQYGLALSVIGEPQLRWFSNGKEIEP